MGKRGSAENPLVHLELRTPNLARACSFYTQLFQWQAETVHVGSASYLSIGLGQIGGGVVEDDARGPLWLPYVEVPAIHATTRLAEELGASIRLEPREGPAGWRSIVGAPAAGDIALWQSKR